MKNILILTVGQRDLQIVLKDSYVEIDKKEMESAHEKLGKLFESNQLEWLPLSLLKKEGKKKGKREDLDIHKEAIKQITFPIIENLFVYLKKNDVKTDKIYLLHTNRQHFKGKINNNFIEGEPYLTGDIFIKFYKDIIKYYELGGYIAEDIETINIGENIPDLNEYAALYPFFDSFFKEISNNKPEKVYIATAGGIPAIRNVIEDLSTLNYPENSVVFEQNYKDDINLSQFHQYKNYYRNYNVLRDSIKRWDFAKALEVYKEMSKDTDSKFVRILNIVNNIFFINEKKAKDNLKKLLKIKKLSETEKDNLNKIKSVLNQPGKNSSFIIYIKFLQVYKQGNYWAAATILITLFEIFFEDTLEFYYPESLVIENNGKNIYKYFNWKNINPDWDYQSAKSDIFKKDDNSLLRNNWGAIDEILNNIIPADRKNIFGFIKNNLLNKAKDFKTNRNNFVHHGISINKKDIDNLLKIKKSNSKFFGSSILNEIFKELMNFNDDYFNWLEYFEEILLKEIKTLVPNVKMV